MQRRNRAIDTFIDPRKRNFWESQSQERIESSQLSHSSSGSNPALDGILQSRRHGEIIACLRSLENTVKVLVQSNKAILDNQKKANSEICEMKESVEHLIKMNKVDKLCLQNVHLDLQKCLPNSQSPDIPANVSPSEFQQSNTFNSGEDMEESAAMSIGEYLSKRLRSRDISEVIHKASSEVYTTDNIAAIASHSYAERKLMGIDSESEKWESRLDSIPLVPRNTVLNTSNKRHRARSPDIFNDSIIVDSYMTEPIQLSEASTASQHGESQYDIF